MNNNGFVLILSVLILTASLLVGSYMVTLSNSEHTISEAQQTATKNYYLAESAIYDMIWKIQNDTPTASAFLDGTLSSTHDISRASVDDDPNASYTVRAISTASSEAQLTATSTYQIGNATSQRVVKAYIAQATGSDPEWDFATFAGGRGSQQNGNFTFTGSGVVFTANGGRLHANQVFKVQGAEVVVNDGMVTSSNNINVVGGGTLTLNNSTQQAPTTTVDMLQIDFDSDDSNSWENRATATYTENQFKNLSTGTTLEGIIYVDGDAKIIGKNITINGVLVADGDIDITLSGNTFTVNSHETYGGGLLAKDDIDMTTSGGTITINGLMYSADDLDITSSGTSFTINGSMAGFDSRITASGGSIILNYSTSTIYSVIDPLVNPSSPLIQIDHWEEQY